MRFGLVLGGGGVVGIAWEIGVLAGLRRAGALPARPDVIVGTSAGSVVGTRLALGHDLDALVEEQRAPAPRPAATEGPPARTGDLSAVMEIFGALRQAPEVTTEVTRVVGAKAMAAETPPEDRWVASFETTLGGRGAAWPSDVDLRIAALDCESGERRMWTRADETDAPLAAAVASSCAVPGMFPTVGIAGRRYTDGGVWSVTNADVLVDAEPSLDAVLLVVPTAAAAAQQPGRRPAYEVEAELLERTGVRTATIVPGPAFATEVGHMNLMNPAKRQAGLEVGLADGAAGVDRVRDLLS
jgi:NTE family protein